MHNESDEFEQPNMLPEATQEEPVEEGTSPDEQSAEEPSADTGRDEAAEEEAQGEAATPSEPDEVARPEEHAQVEPSATAQTDEVAEEGSQAESVVPAEPGEVSESGEPSPDQPAWYVVHCYSGYENKVRHNLEQRIETMGMKDKIFEVVIPTQEEIEVREGKRRTVERHIFPGYVLVNMILTEESWYVVRNTPGVTGFVGMGTSPTPLRPEEVNQIIKRMEAEAPRVKVSFKEGERVRIIDGPFNDFRGTVAEIDIERSKVRVMVSMFGRETPVELDFLQVERA